VRRGVPKGKRVRSKSKNSEPNPGPQNLETLSQNQVQNQDQNEDLALKVAAAKAAVLQRLEEKKDELVKMYRIVLDFPVTRDLLLRIWRSGRVPVDLLLNMLVLDYKKTKHEAEVIINNFISLGLLIPRSPGNFVAFRKKRSRACVEVYCTLDTPAELFNKCCEILEAQQVVVEASPVLEELANLYYAEKEP